MGKNNGDGITWVITRVVRPTPTPFVGAYVHKDKRGPINCSNNDHGDFCLYCVASSELDKLAPHLSSGSQSKKNLIPANHYVHDLSEQSSIGTCQLTP